MAGITRREAEGVLAACLSSMLGGSAVVATRAVIPATDPATLASMRFGIGLACLLPLVLLGRNPRPRRADWLPVALLGLLFFAAFPWLFNQALAFTTAAHGSLALSTLPFLTLLVAAALGAERLTLPKLLGVGSAVIGVAMALSSQLQGMPPGAWRGDLLMAAGALCGAFYNVLGRRFLQRYPALVFTAWTMLAGTLAMATLSAAIGAPSRLAAFSPASWAIVLYLGIGGAAAAFWLWSFALSRISPTGVAVTVALNPVVALSLGTLLLGEPWGLRLILGLGLVASGVVLVNAAPAAQPGWAGRLPR